jgi:hypothetical protein
MGHSISRGNYSFGQKYGRAGNKVYFLKLVACTCKCNYQMGAYIQECIYILCVIIISIHLDYPAHLIILDFTFAIIVSEKLFQYVIFIIIILLVPFRCCLLHPVFKYPHRVPYLLE